MVCMQNKLTCVIALCALCALFAACSDGEKARLKATTLPTYDKATGKLKEVTFDFNKNGRIDTWTEMDGAKPVRARVDLDEDGTIDRWEYYDENAKLVKIGFSRKDDGRPDAWAYRNAQGGVQRIEASSVYDPQKIDRWETYRDGVLANADEDQDGDGKPDRRLTYDAAGAIIVIETEADGSGGYRTRARPK